MPGIHKKRNINLKRQRNITNNEKSSQNQAETDENLKLDQRTIRKEI